jgi:hypothetical protein
MKKNIYTIIRYRILLPVILCFITDTVYGFDWPQNEVMSDSFYSYFGQLRGSTINNSIVFGESSEVKAADKGRIIAILDEEGGDYGWFQSTLGNAVIVAHEDNIESVYANLDRNSRPKNISTLTTVETGTSFGTSTNSGWQQGKSCLEFQVIDIRNHTVINPRILMPRIGKELELNIRNVTAVNKKGISIPLGLQRSIPAGSYLLYRERQQTAMPYRTTVSINGAVVETITYDTLVQDHNRLCVVGRKKYPVELIYPDEKRQLLGDVVFPRGHISVSISVTDILGQQKTMTYTAEAF